jgi:hypothetical protein
MTMVYERVVGTRHQPDSHAEGSGSGLGGGVFAAAAPAEVSAATAIAAMSFTAGFFIG